MEQALAKLLPGGGGNRRRFTGHAVQRARRRQAIARRVAVTACRAAGGDEKKALPLAAAIEMIHAYSLVHDDLPAMDDDDLRRGKPTNHKVFGEGIAILAGDALLTRAFWVLGRLPELVGATASKRWPSFRSYRSGRDHGLDRWTSSGFGGGRPREVTVDELRSIHMRKTGALFSASLRSGALLANASADVLQTVTAYADAFGLAFQIADDILDVTGDESTLGKQTGRDSDQEKATYPRCSASKRPTSMAVKAADDARRAAEKLPAPASDVLVYLAAFAVERDR